MSTSKSKVARLNYILVLGSGMVVLDWVAWAAFACLVALRMRRRGRGTHIARLWVGPAIVGIVSAAALWSYPPGSVVQIATLGGALLVGIALGALRGWATPIHFDRHSRRVRTRMTLAMAPALVAIVGARFAARYGIRSGMIAGLAAISVTASAFLMLGMVGTRQTLLYLKVRRLRNSLDPA